VKTLKIRYLLLTLFLVLLFASSLYAYSDFAINDITLRTAVTGDENLDVNLVIANNSDSAEDILITINIYNPKGELIAYKTNDYDIASKTTEIETVTFFALTDVNLISSTQPYAVRASITNETNGNLSNNTFTKYFTVTKSSKKIPVPDMPFYLPFVIAFLVAFFVIRNKKTKNKK